MAEQTLLQIVQDVSRRLNLEVPSLVIASTDTTVLQLLGFINEEVESHPSREYNFPQLRIAATFTYSTAASYNALDLSTIPSLRDIIPKTLWNQTTRFPVMGPVSDRDWQAMVTLGVSSAQDNYRVDGSWLRIYPGHTTVQTYSYLYMSDYAVISSLGVLQENFLADNDMPLLPSRVVKLGLTWRWKRSKGQPYADEIRDYELMLQEIAARSDIPGDLSMDGISTYPNVAEPGLLIAAGNWPL